MCVSDWGKGMHSAWGYLVFVFLLLTGCESSDPGCQVEPRFELLGDQEAELIALCLANELVAPEELYAQIKGDLAAIRSDFAEEVPMVTQITFRPPWEQSAIIVTFKQSTAAKIAAGEYTAWDELNQKYRLISFDIMAEFGLANLRFEGLLNPRCLCKRYRDLPGAEQAGPNFYMGDFSNIYARIAGGGITYLFFHGAGDCPGGCTEEDYWYFRFDQGQPELVGERLEGQPEPGWWKEAEKNIEAFQMWYWY
jgi:hypothetical protein